MVIQFFTMVPAAYAFARMEFKGKNIFWSLTLICLMIPMQLIFLPNYLMFSKVHLINTLLAFSIAICNERLWNLYVKTGF